jgi:hypothetical protein
LFFLLFVDNSDDDTLIKRALDNASDFDHLQYLASQGIAKSTEYFDVNRCLKIRDKMSAPEGVGPLFERVLERFKRVTKKRGSKEVVKQANAMMLNLAKNPESKKGDLIAVIKQL